MRRPPAKKQRYHHGDLRAALVDTAVDLIAERGVAGFSLAEASRRLGVAVSAPYRHFADRDELLAAVGVRACQVLVAAVDTERAGADGPVAELAAISRAYVRFAVAHRPLFDAAFGAKLDRTRYPELDAATRPLKEAFLAAALALSDGDRDRAEALAVAVGVTAHGHATMALLGGFGPGGGTAVDRADAAARALVAGRTALGTYPEGMTRGDHGGR
ncbi:TetR/AcrR family transcriptional regulator [Actinocatenispora rupis]|uniref:TetR family transcriptional regulator n=1 Tax=Actinocatenispora rupis TaxID=519421 RepID=A0A8J3J8V1_9ACTN|nr:TetR/AcrR family transcriptional regulator [Actinocatenispora rupis]GID14020.1 TetR family transcriptional regulator [Actinocatenispora rupis]